MDTLHILFQIIKVQKWLRQSLVSPSAWNLAEEIRHRNNCKARETDYHGRQSRVMDIGGEVIHLTQGGLGERSDEISSGLILL